MVAYLQKPIFRVCKCGLSIKVMGVISKVKVLVYIQAITFQCLELEMLFILYEGISRIERSKL